MQDFLSLTLSGIAPAEPQGRNAELAWRWLDRGIIELTPHRPVDHSLVLSTGIHGNETAPVEIVAAQLAALLNGDIPLSVRLLVIFGNPPALVQNKRYLNVDMNRLFGGRWRQIPDGDEARRAARLEQALAAFWPADREGETRWHLDMHTAIRGSLHPRFGVMPQRNAPWPADFLQWLAAAGLEALVFHRAPGGTFTHYSGEQFAAASCTLELGKALPFGRNDLSQFAAADRALTALLSGAAWPAAEALPKHYRVAQQITRVSEGFTLHMGPETLNFTAFEQGTLLAEAADQRWVVEQPQEYVLFPNPSVATGQRAGLMLVEDPSRAGDVQASS